MTVKSMNETMAEIFAAATMGGFTLFPEQVETSNPLNASPYVTPLPIFHETFRAWPGRERLLQGLLAAHRMLDQAGAQVQAILVGGSFLDRATLQPKDLDCVFFYRMKSDASEGFAGRLAPLERQFRSYGLDARLIPIDANPVVALKAMGFFCNLYTQRRQPGDVVRGQILIDCLETAPVLLPAPAAEPAAPVPAQLGKRIATLPSTQCFDAIVIGGGTAGLTAATTLVSAGRNVALIDAGNPRNQGVGISFGFPGFFGETPESINERLLQDIATAGSSLILRDKVITLSCGDDGALISTATGQELGAQAVLYAGGCADILPNIPGLAPLWKRLAFECPYCEAGKLAGAVVAILALRSEDVARAELLACWAAVVLVVVPPGAPLPKRLADNPARFRILQDALAGLEETGDGTVRIVTKSGATAEVDMLFLATGKKPADDLLVRAGSRMRDNGFPHAMANGQTSLARVFVTGEAAGKGGSQLEAANDGTHVGRMVNHFLLTVVPLPERKPRKPPALRLDK